MKIQTKYHGEVIIEKSGIITFDNGIPGFIDEKHFTVLPFGNDSVISIMQSVETKELAFVIADPFTFFKEYDFTLEDQNVEQLELQSEADVTVYTILTVEDPFEETTANLQAPIIINNKKLKGKQVILTSSPYKTKHKIFKRITTGTK